MTRLSTMALALLACPSVLAAQHGALRAQLVARGLPDALTVQIESVAVRAAGEGLPWEPLADKAIEGYAKHVPAARIVAAVRVFAGRMGEGRVAVQGAGVGAPDGALIRAAADALGSGLASPEIGTVVRAAPQLALAAPALTVAAALRAQGLTTDQAVSVVVTAMRNGRGVPQILDIPSLARAMQQQGMSPPEVGRRLLGPGGPLSGGPGGPGGGPGGGGRGGPGGRLPPGGGLPPLPRPPQPPIPTP
jgi:hypothetical protein